MELTDSAGSVAQSYVYESFGNIVFETENIDNVVKYTGREFDSESGLYYYRNRYYDANIELIVSGLDIGHKENQRGRFPLIWTRLQLSQILEKGMQFSPPGII